MNPLATAAIIAAIDVVEAAVRAKIADAATTADERAQLEARIASFHADNQALNDKWASQAPKPA